MTTEAATSGEASGGAGGLELQDWQRGLGPRYLALFLLVVFFDQFGRETVAVGGLLSALGGAVAASVLAGGVLFVACARWGFFRKGTTAELIERSFGASASRWFIGLLLSAVQMGWFGLAISYAATFTLRGLEVIRVLPADTLAPWTVAGTTLSGGPVWLSTIVIWSLAAAVLGPLLVRIVAAVLYAYQIFVVLMLGGVMVWALGGLSNQPVLAASQATSARAFWNGCELVFAFSTIGLLGAADWAAATRTWRDVRIGGLAGMAFAPPIVLAITMVSLLGALGYQGPPDASVPPMAGMAATAVAPRFDADDFVYHETVLAWGIGGAAGWALLTALALPLLGPACYAPAAYGKLLNQAMPRLSRMAWAILGAVATWPFIAGGYLADVSMLMRVLGAVTGPIVGCLAATSFRATIGAGSRLHYRSRRWNMAGMLAWLIGTTISLVPVVGRLTGQEAAARFPAAVILGTLVAALFNMMLSWWGLDGRPETATGDGQDWTAAR